MSGENVEIVRSILAGWERGDFSSAHWAHPDIEFIRVDGPAPGRWTGVPGLPEGTRELLDAWTDIRYEVDEYRELDRERVLVLVRLSGKAKCSGVPLEEVASHGAHVFTLRDGKVIQLVHYFDRSRALENVGLSE